jgi:hypothetical protein
MKFIVLVFLLANPISQLMGQDCIGTGTSKGKLYLHWGWNRSAYTPSNIHFTGAYYDFTLKDVAATDRPSPFGFDPYFHPLKITIPQVNYGAGYFFKNNWSIYMGVDHMKYIVTQGQKVTLDGQIMGTKFAGTYSDSTKILHDDFIYLEHTDGLNFIHIELAHYDSLFCFKDFAHVRFTKGGSAGIIYPRTNAAFLGNESYDEFNLAGYGFSAKIGLHITFWEKLFIQVGTKGGFIHMPNIRTTTYTDDRASQHFFFLQANVLFGGMISLNKP